MYILYADDTNLEASSESRYFIYGGVFFPMEKLNFIDKSIRKIRDKTGYKDGDELKFNIKSRPSYVTKEQHVWAKGKVLELAYICGVKFISYLCFHPIITNKENKIKFAIDHITGKFNYFLSKEAKDEGICFIDKFSPSIHLL